MEQKLLIIRICYNLKWLKKVIIKMKFEKFNILRYCEKNFLEGFYLWMHFNDSIMAKRP
jgi:hypothetical protein